jgi:hypothetical protein
MSEFAGQTDQPSDPQTVARLLRNIAADVETGRFPAWVVGRCHRVLDAELPVWMVARRERPRLRVVR